MQSEIETNKPDPYYKVFTTVSGLFTGAIYGLLLAILIGKFTKQPFNSGIIGWSTLVFGVVGFIKGNVVFEALLMLLHFGWGYVNGQYNGRCENLQMTEPQNYFRVFMWVGFATGLVVYLSRRFSS